MKITDIDALVIKKTDYGEGHRILTLLSEEKGKIKATVKSIKKSKNREIYASDVLVLGSYTINYKESSSIINKLNVKEPYLEIKKNFFKLQIAFYLLKIVDSVTFEGMENKKIYKLLINSLDYIKKSDDEKMILIMISYFLYKISGFEGLSFKIEGEKYFDFENGKISNEKSLNTIELNSYQSRYLQLLNKVDINAINELQSSNKNICALIRILEKYINFNLHLGLRIYTYLGEEVL
jgi:DNA repair protein RecO (recombination protein O)